MQNPQCQKMPISRQKTRWRDRDSNPGHHNFQRTRRRRRRAPVCRRSTNRALLQMLPVSRGFTRLWAMSTGVMAQRAWDRGWHPSSSRLVLRVVRDRSSGTMRGPGSDWGRTLDCCLGDRDSVLDGFCSVATRSTTRSISRMPSAATIVPLPLPDVLVDRGDQLRLAGSGSASRIAQSFPASLVWALGAAI
jgi:hypothetical protein